MGLAFMVTSTGLWHRITNNLQFDFSQLSICMRGTRAKLKAGFRLHVQNRPVPESAGAILVQKPCLDIRAGSWEGGRKSAGDASTSSTDSRKKGNHGKWFSSCVTV